MDYPNTKFVVFTGLTNSANVASIFPMQQEGSFLLGALAGWMTNRSLDVSAGVSARVGEGDPNIINISSCPSLMPWVKGDEKS